MSPNRLCWLNPDDSPEQFPDVEEALSEPEGLLAAGGDLSERRLLAAYRKGIFPWFDDGQPILWWSPDPRCILRPADLHISRRLRQQLRNSTAEVRYLVLPMRPDGTAGWTEEALMDLVTRDSMIGTGLAKAPA